MRNNIGDARREYADRNGKFTQEDAAAYFGVSLSTYKKWEQGQGMMNGSQLRAIAEKYETTVDYLLRMDEHREPTASPVVALSPEEQELIGLYRASNAHGREQMMIFARGCAATNPLNQAVSASA